MIGNIIAIIGAVNSFKHIRLIGLKNKYLLYCFLFIGG